MKNWPSRAASRRGAFLPGMASFRCREQDISIHTEISVAPDDDVEVRRITVTNESDQRCCLRLTTYGEVVLDFYLLPINAIPPLPNSLWRVNIWPSRTLCSLVDVLVVLAKEATPFMAHKIVPSCRGALPLQTLGALHPSTTIGRCSWVGVALRRHLWRLHAPLLIWG